MAPCCAAATGAQSPSPVTLFALGCRDLRGWPVAGRAVLHGSAPSGTPCPLLGAAARLVRCCPWLTAPHYQHACRSLTPCLGHAQVGKARWAAQATVVSASGPGAVNVRLDVFVPADLAAAAAKWCAPCSVNSFHQAAKAPSCSAKLAGHWHPTAHGCKERSLVVPTTTSHGNFGLQTGCCRLTAAS